ncbi:flagellar export chaperone FliS [Marinospirillum sp. MEB164]|uniref:Flagellar export chaperone FliS n=1 Tax=Marinospirillum alkalitolerans TaxID=3123374 RepID=A0ABW8PVY2_9GAMM
MKMKQPERRTAYLMQRKAQAWAEQVNFNHHLRSVIESADPHELINLLYKGLGQHLEALKGALTRFEPARKTLHSTKALFCVNELRLSLRHELYPQLAENLNLLYEYMTRQIAWMLLQPMHPNFCREALRRLDEIQQLLQPLAASWLRLTEGAKAYRARVDAEGQSSAD